MDLGAVIKGNPVRPEVVSRQELFKANVGPAHVKLSDPAFVIFTSGTSGPSKPALFSHERMIGAGIAWSIRTAMTSVDRCYICLPLCHGNGLAMAFSSVVAVGACAIIRERFSVSQFWDDINRNNCTHMVYIGELWRYLLNSRSADSRNSSLRVIFGNGLSRNIWTQVIERFGIEHIVEHYGATEMPASALTNWTGNPGACGFVPPNHEDQASVLMVDEQLCPAPMGCPAEILLKVPANRQYHGYLFPDLNDAKVVKLDIGQVWWRSGDLLTRDSNGYYYFHERLGDNYRFKGENISSVDVEQVILGLENIAEVCVYGVRLPYRDGSLGMASIFFNDHGLKLAEADLFLSSMLAKLRGSLASHSIPHLLRFTRDPHQTTTTLKIVKHQLKHSGIECWSSEPHFALINGHYSRIDLKLYDQIMNGNLRLGF
jgi:fatty-acyl-CoA synthase